MTDDTDNPFLTIDETASLLRVKRRTLDNLRWQGDGPPFRRHGGRIVYKRDEVLAWSEQRRARIPPSEGGQEPPAARSNNDRPRCSRDYVAESEYATSPLEHQP